MSPVAEKLHSLNQHAEENLRYIRSAMESASSFTGVSGKGYVLAGISAAIAAAVAGQQLTADAWLLVWMLELVLAAAMGLGLTVRKANRQGMPVWSHSGRKLLLAFLPAMTAGALLTLSFYLHETIELLPGIWLSLYGAAVMTAGLWSVRIIPLMGICFLLLGALVLLTPVPGDLMLGLGFGGLHVIFGSILWRYYGG